MIKPHILILALALPSFAAERPERWYQEQVAAELKGKMEVPHYKLD
jgi:hypothetical protein